MKKLKKVLSHVLIIGFISMMVLPVLVIAAGPVQPPPEPIKTWGDVEEVMTLIRNIMWAVLGVVVIVMFIWAGITFFGAEGDPTKVEAARKRVMYGLIGVVVAAIAGGIVALITSLLG